MRQQAGSCAGVPRDGAILSARLRLRGTDRLLSLTTSRIIDGRGIRRDCESHATPLVADSIFSGRGRIDPAAPWPP
ncbi:hypothetical protein [Paracoccus spongiarum]|uniref:Uncharacterized protein n=1 Tax=Paracoccus spongiarum TaxID=3064387 RepID=A0ABT9JFZ5_9RHOB|nr:hypothetical protein [Paracoccus sp. 2205BS29-5]MDP5308699.1 hypothetical protein [Paracoccus sp. 2205BS29-5]